MSTKPTVKPAAETKTEEKNTTTSQDVVQPGLIKPTSSTKISDVKGFETQLKKDYKEVEVWEDPAFGQIYARVTGEVDTQDDFSGKTVKKDNTRLLAVSKEEFKDPSFYGLFKNRLGL